jgi:uncharacterized protein (TIGR02246 family)
MRLFLLSTVILRASVLLAQDDSAIKSVVSRYLEAREQQNAAALEALFTEDADQLVSSGEWRRGRDAIVKGTLSSSETTPGRRTISVEAVRFLSPDVALADGRYEISGPAGGQNRRMWSAFLFIRTSDGWRIAAIRNMLPAAPAAGAAK